MAKTNPISVRLSPEVKDGMQKHADADRRSLAAMIDKALAEWLEQQARKKD